MHHDAAKHVLQTRSNRRIATVVAVALAFAGAILATSRGRNQAWSMYTRVMGRATVEQRLSEVGPAARSRMSGDFNRIGLPYPPPRVALLILKEERVLEFYVAANRSAPSWQFLKAYPIIGSSGTSGPKLAEGDMQVPEGIHAIESVNPNSRFHLALRVQYPNDHDRARAKADGRTRLGSDIMIHGGSASVGCLAMGDRAIEELFALTVETGIENVDVIIAPRDLRSKDRSGLPVEPKWVGDLYDEIKSALSAFPASSTVGQSGR